MPCFAWSFCFCFCLPSFKVYASACLYYPLCCLFFYFSCPASPVPFFCSLFCFLLSLCLCLSSPFRCVLLFLSPPSFLSCFCILVLLFIFSVCHSQHLLLSFLLFCQLCVPVHLSLSLSSLTYLSVASFAPHSSLNALLKSVTGT